MAWIARSLAAAGLLTNVVTAAALAMVGPAPAPSTVRRVMNKASPTAFAVATSRTTDGLFHLDGKSGSASIQFVVDTGASVTVLTPEDARVLKAVRLDDQDRPPLLQTAGGQTGMTWSRIADLEVAGQHLGPVDVAIVEGGLHRSLLGQNILARLGRITIADDQLFVTADTD